MGSYIVDFACLTGRLVVELDGGQHAVDKEKDRARDCWLKDTGFKVLRFWDNEVFENLDGVLDMIRNHLVSPHPDPLPEGEGVTRKGDPLSGRGNSKEERALK